MASYTMPLRAIIEHYSQNQPFLTVKERIEIGRQHLFDFDYPFYDENKRAEFETKFIRFFYMSEIGFETEYLFKFNLETWLLYNMNFWNKKFSVNEIDYNPLINTSLTSKKGKSLSENEVTNNSGLIQTNGTENKVETSEIDFTSNKDDVSNTNLSNFKTHSYDKNLSDDELNNTDTVKTDNNFNRNIYAETPESRLALTSNADGSGTVEYASNITENKNTYNDNEEIIENKLKNLHEDGTQNTDTLEHSDKTGNSNTVENTFNNNNKDVTTQQDTTQNFDITRGLTNNENVIEVLEGKTGNQSYQKMLKEYQDNLVNIEAELFNSMKILFMLVY